jgi:hypothetical protein
MSDSIARNPNRKIRGKKDVNVWNDSQNGSDILSWAGDMLSFPGIAGQRENRANILKLDDLSECSDGPQIARTYHGRGMRRFDRAQRRDNPLQS